MIVLLAEALPPPAMSIEFDDPLDPMIRLPPLVRLPPLRVSELLEALVPCPITVLLVTLRPPGAVITRALEPVLVPMIRLPIVPAALVMFAVPPLLIATVELLDGWIELLQLVEAAQSPLVAVQLMVEGRK